MSGVNKNGKTLNRAGASQKGRLNEALLPAHVKVDERSIKDFLAYMVEYAAHIKYYNTQNEEDGDWSNFFLKDVSVLWSVILRTDAQKVDQTRLAIVEAVVRTRSKKAKIGKLKDVFKFIYDLAKRFDYWYIKSNEVADAFSDDYESITLELENAIKYKLAAPLKKIIAYDLGAAQSKHIGERIGLDYSGLSETWGVDDTIEPENIFDEHSKPHQSINYAVKTLNLLYRNFLNALHYILNVAPRHLNNSLLKKKNHSPDVGLFIAFLKLFQHAQEHLNTLSKQHLEYYYETILQQTRKPATPDHIFVHFGLTENAEEYLLKEGTQLLGEKNDKGIAPIYSVNQDTLLNRGQIVAAKTIFVGKNLLIGVGSSYRLVSNIFAAPIANSADGKGIPFETGKERWATFGEDQIDKTAEERNMVEADVGLVIASPIFYLSEGERKVDIVFNFSSDSMKTYRMLIEDISRNEKIKAEDAFRKIFNKSIRLFLTGEKEWLEVERYEILPPKASDSSEVILGFTLPMSFPPIMGNNPEVFDTKYNTPYPLFKLILSSQESNYIYSFLRDLVLTSVDIAVDVKRIRELELYNDVGKLDANLPFQPFGPVPSKGSYMAIGYTEAFKKNLTNLNFNIEWQNLPATYDNGFGDYYKEYNLGIDNDTFEIELTALSDNEFRPTPEEKSINYKLFTTKETVKGDGLHKKTRLSLEELGRLNINPNYDLAPAPNFDNNTRSGFFKLELSNPPHAFGHDVFPKIFTEVVTENAKTTTKGLFNKQDGDDSKPIPKQPYTPMVKSFSMDYSATTKIDLSSGAVNQEEQRIPEQIYHLHPFGYQQTFDKGRVYNRQFLPLYEEDGYLFLGLVDIKPPTSLTMYFELAESKKGDTLQLTPTVTWSYLSDNVWKPFYSEDILSDGTNNFTTTGIVQLNIPGDISKGNSVLSADYFWLRVAVKGDVDILSDTIALNTQAAKATWIVNDEDEEHLLQPLRPLQVNRLVYDEPEIRDVYQPFSSFGGKPKENDEEFYTRVSERLRHKGRAVTHWDYERLILNQFPEIAQVKCLTHLTHPDFINYGHVMMVVIPKVEKQERGSEPRSNFNTLKQIKNYLNKRTSFFARIDVRNPIYERVKITCSVLFKNGRNNGLFLQKLNREINEFLSPWLFGSDESYMNLGGSINKDVIINFIEQRPYVKFVTKVSIVQVITNDEERYKVKDTAHDEVESNNVIAASKPWSILVPFEKHQIYFLDEETFQTPEASALGNMAVGVDFIVRDEDEEEEDFIDTIENDMKILEAKDVDTLSKTDYVFYMKTDVNFE